MTVLPYLSVAALLILIQLSVQRAFGATICIGDECDYIRAGNAADPYAPGVFLRVPFMAWLSQCAHRLSSNPERFLRAATQIASGITVLICMLCAQFIGGVEAALLTGFLLAIMPGRIILSRRIWPDIWLGLWLSLVCLALTCPDLSVPLRALLVGVISTFAFITRFDALLLAPFCGFALSPLSPVEWVSVLTPTVIAFALLSLRNARRYQIPWPDNTWMFNVMVAVGESSKTQASHIHVAQEISQVAGAWNKLDDSSRFTAGMTGLRKLAARPLRFLSGVLMKLWASLGPDSFVLQRLLPPDGAAYPEIPDRLNRFLKVSLTIAFPVFISTTVLVVLVSEKFAPIVLWPTMAFLLTTLIHNRTRYRQAWLPGAALVLVTALSEPGIGPLLFSSESFLEWIIAVALGISLIRFRVRPDTLEKP